MFNFLRQSLCNSSTLSAINATTVLVSSKSVACHELCSLLPHLSIQSSNFHTTNAVSNKRWRPWRDDTNKDPDWFLKHNDKKYPPQELNETPRPAFVCHDRKHIQYSPKKMWYVAGMIRGLSIEDAINQLKFVHRKGAVDVLEVIQEAQKIAVENHNVEFSTNLWVSESFCYQDHMLKTIRRHAKGRIGVIKHRYVRYCVTLEEGTPPLHYYHFKRDLSAHEKLDNWVVGLRERVIPDNL